MPYAYGATIEHEFDTDHLNLWLTFRHPMDQDLKPPLALWLLEEDDNAVDIIDSNWQDEFTLLLTSDTVADAPERVLLEYNGPNSNLQTTWGKDWEPWGPKLSTDIGKAPCFVDRGDLAVFDFDQTDFTFDSIWRDIDLSGIVPSGAVAVAIYIRVENNTVGANFRMRQKGNAFAGNISMIYTQAANVFIAADWQVSIDSNRFAQYFGSPVGFDTLGIYIKGWWF